MNIQHFLENGDQKFPLSTAALDFIQEQIKLVYGLTDLAGTNIIIKNSTATTNGLIIFGGELLPLSGTPSRYIYVNQQVESLSIEGFDGNVRTSRIAVYSSSFSRTATQQAYASQFTVLKNISTLMTEFEEAKKHHLPKGSIIDWYGECKAANIPYGFVPCGWFGVGLTLNEIANELTAWQTKYGANNISIGRVHTSGSRLVISSCNGQTVPLLTDKFIVQAGHSYNLGDTGGSDRVTLSASQSGLPNSVVNGISKTTGKAYSGTSASQHDCVNTLSYTTQSSHAASESHENRPPYFALYKLIKVI